MSDKTESRFFDRQEMFFIFILTATFYKSSERSHKNVWDFFFFFSCCLGCFYPCEPNCTNGACYFFFFQPHPLTNGVRVNGKDLANSDMIRQMEE